MKCFMARIKSLLTRTAIDEAGKAHNCQRDAGHRIQKGQKRLKVRNGRSWDHYCLVCAKLIVESDERKLRELADAISAAASTST